MPITELHKLKKNKNRTTLLIILGVIALLFCVTIVKVTTQ